MISSSRTSLISFTHHFSPFFFCFVFSLISLGLTSCLSTRPAKSTSDNSLPPGSSHSGNTLTTSWYGKPFHGRQTASGETYDMYQLTAAHKTLPFGTVLRLQHAQNGNTVRVTINDRGPFVEGRDLDVSYAAAKQLDMMREGVAEVYVWEEERNRKYINPVRDTSSQTVQRNTGSYSIQLGSFSNSHNANRLKQALSYSYSNAYVDPVKIQDKTYYRVRIGPYPQHQQALQQAKKLAYEGYKPLVTSR